MFLLVSIDCMSLTVGLFSTFSLQNYSRKKWIFFSCWQRSSNVLLNSSNERQLLYVALGSFQPTECRCQILQLKGTFMKRLIKTLKNKVALAAVLAIITFYQVARQLLLCAGKWTRKSHGPGSESEIHHISCTTWAKRRTHQAFISSAFM